ncbi:Aste57867_15680 [Aphanomyces stellatus]|uniref:Aste57867_15680 protein n=1 Tax=Aphanomyces stellatus TaxID=120398 RepID=A0A485L4P2_9STRA|nr:hypothetical protein As57867_015624 [Aphanomyces stellatus]VFT92473.1 Aste57867_15680 [Aphanomyces stellatus]
MRNAKQHHAMVAAVHDGGGTAVRSTILHANRYSELRCRELLDDEDDDDPSDEKGGTSHHDVDDEHISFKMRLWDYLFRNVNSAVDELYCMCELESSTPRCEEAARVLVSCHEDFVKLVERIQMQSRMSSKASLAWEVKKGSNVVKPTVVKALERMAKSFSPVELVTEKPDSSRPASPAPSSTDTVVQELAMHQKLSLPRKPKRSPSETKLLSEQRLDTVNANKHAIESARLSRIRMAAERMQDVTSRNLTSRKKQKDLMWEKLARADRLKQAHLRWIVTKAGSENTKVDEINFIQTLMHQDRKIELQQRLDHVAVRRENLLRQIKDKASLKAESIRAAAKAKEEQLELRLHEIQKRHEGVQARRLKYQQEKNAKGKKRRGQQKRHNHVAIESLQHPSTLEASMENTMRKNAQRLRDRMRALTKHGFPHSMPPLTDHIDDILRQLHRHIDAANDSGLHSVLQTMPASDIVHPCRSLLKTLAHVPTLRWASKPTIATALRLLLALSAPFHPHVDVLLADNLVLPLVDVLVWALQHWDRNDVLLWALPMVSLCLGPVSSSKLETIRDDVIRYIVNVGILFRIADRFALVSPAVTQQTDLFRLTLYFLVALTNSPSAMHRRQLVPRTMADLRVPLVKIFKTTGLLGIVSLLLMSFPFQLYIEMGTATQPSSPSPHLLTLSALILRALNNIAAFDVAWFQATLGSATHQQTFLHLVHAVLAATAAARTDTTSPSSMDDVLTELLHLIGFYALKSPPHQESLRLSLDGAENIIQRVATLPFQFFSETRYKDILFPTLIAMCWKSDENTAILEADMNCIMLVVYLRRHLAASTTALEAWTNESTKKTEVDPADKARRHLAARFPMDMWDDAMCYFDARSKLLGDTTLRP